MDKIIEAIPIEDYRIKILTSSGISGIFDVKPYLKGSAFKELSDESYFRLVRPAHHGIAWPHEQDFSSGTILWDMQNSRLYSSCLWPSPNRYALSGKIRDIFS